MKYLTTILVATFAFSGNAFAGKCKNPLDSKTISQLKRNSWCVLVEAAQEAELTAQQQQQVNNLVKRSIPLLKDVQMQGVDLAKDVYKVLQEDNLQKSKLEDLRKETIENVDSSSKDLLDIGSEAIDILDVQQRKIILQSIRKQLRK